MSISSALRFPISSIFLLKDFLDKEDLGVLLLESNLLSTFLSVDFNSFLVLFSFSADEFESGSFFLCFFFFFFLSLDFSDLSLFSFFFFLAFFSFSSILSYELVFLRKSFLSIFSSMLPLFFNIKVSLLYPAVKNTS
jgi:hypothetical protein